MKNLHISVCLSDAIKQLNCCTFRVANHKERLYSFKFVLAEISKVFNGHPILGSIVMDFRALKSQMAQFGYDGDFIIEVYRRNFVNLDELVCSKRFIETLI